MPQALAPLIIKAGAAIGVKISAALASVIASTVVAVGVQIGTSLVFGGPRGTEPQETETSVKNPIPPRIRGYGRRRLYGASLLFRTASDGTTVDVWAFHDGRIGGVVAVYLNDDLVTLSGNIVNAGADKRYQGGNVKAGYTLGLPTETAFGAVIAKVPDVWTVDHRGDGVVTGYLLKNPEKDKYFLETYPQGDNIDMSLVMDLAPVFDFRDEAQDAYDPATWVHKDNAVLAFLHYLITQRAVDFDTQILPQIALWEAAADDCDAAEPLDAGGTEPRYRTAVVYRATEQPANVIAELLKPFDGWYSYNERGEILIYSGRYYEPTVTIGADEIVSYRHQAFVEDENAVNEVTITYVSDQHDYNTVDAQPWRDEAAIAASGREPLTASLDAQTPSPTQGRRLAKRKMLRANAAHRGACSTTFAGRTIIGQRYINLDLSESGFSGPVEIISLERNTETGGVNFEWLSVDADPDEWVPGVDDGEPPPPVVDPVLDALPQPVINDITAITDEGDVVNGYRLELAVTGPDRPDLTWFVRLLIDGAYGPAQQFQDTAPGPSVLLVTDSVPANTPIGVEVSYRTGDGRPSPWSDTESITIESEVEDVTSLLDTDKLLISRDGLKYIEAQLTVEYFKDKFDLEYLQLDPAGASQTVLGPVVVSGNLETGGTLVAAGTGSFGGTLTVTTGGAAITGDSSIAGNLDVSGTVSASAYSGGGFPAFGAAGAATGADVTGRVVLTIGGASYTLATI
ncbi:hypothetical protein [Sphingomonas baiyangensis]|uniref:Tip attachment protein J domain-containing protein n=1 Tax=Sphingomonas baiyangensis TaxID=2572576 RepID=A0A4V6WRE8_9SPHN|nr:hypothetical protein [Sphingomonas baiyangensis]TKD50228.1 hypothetical protein FBR43_05255 [Sphingomonas baiyangensis]